MPESADPDLVDYLFWGRSLRGLSDNTLRTRLEVLQRFSRWLPVPLREATPDQLLGFEKIAIAGRAAETRRAYVCHIRTRSGRAGRSRPRAQGGHAWGASSRSTTSGWRC